jgi:formylglycine-generating enzyme required for sulfatase activity/tRNA A-37 threonylcarbamoyl transferase component Bud32
VRENRQIIGMTIGNLRIISEIGKGGMGTVYLAENVNLKKRFAVKSLHPALTQDPQFRERFYQEGLNQALLDHPNIVQVTDFIDENGQFLLVMEYVDGQSLSQVIKAKGKFEEREALSIFKQVLEGLDYAHRQGVINRDIKPSNILIDKNSRVRITDFGIAILVGTERLTATGATVGTPWYMSPEQILHPRDMDHRSDVYSAGIVLYEMLTGDVPFDGETEFEIKNKQVHSPPPDPRQKNPEISPRMAEITLKALEKDPSNRFEGCHQFLNAANEAVDKSYLIKRGSDRTGLPKPPALHTALLRSGAFRLLVMLVLGVLGGVGVYHLGKKWFEPLPVTAPPVQTSPASAPTEAKPTPAVSLPPPQEPSAKSPSLPPLQNIHGWPAQQVGGLQQQTAQVLKMPVEFTDALKAGGHGPVMVVIPGGRFQMGSPETEPEREDDEQQHEVEVAAFAISKYEVTFEEYDRFAEATKREKPSDKRWGRGRRPIINVTWNDAVAYAEWLSQQTGKSYRLPTEAEWEYAARAGTTTPFYFGETISTDQANYKVRKGVYRGKTVEVGQFPANAWGLHDMHGNVWEWTCSVYNENYDGGEQRCVEPNTSGLRALRGGSWGNSPGGVRAAFRGWSRPDERLDYWGFRLARAL